MAEREVQQPLVTVDELREAIYGLALYVVVGENDKARDVRNRNRMAKPRLFDAVLLDDLWDVLDSLYQADVEERWT